MSRSTAPRSVATRYAARLAILAGAAVLAACAAPPAAPVADDAMTASATPTPAMTDDAMTDDAMAGDATASPAMSDAPAGLDPADAPAQLQFTATTLDGKAFDGTSLYGHPTVVYFWASWCPICQGEASGIAAALKELPDGVQAIGIPGRSDTASMQQFVGTYGLSGMTQVVDDTGSLWANFNVAYQPALVTIAADGTVTTLSSDGKAGFLEAARSIAP